MNLQHFPVPLNAHSVLLFHSESPVTLVVFRVVHVSLLQGPVHYRFDYGVYDPHTGDQKQHYERRDGDVVKGSYSLKEADGTTRIVEYHADPKGGFKAVVKRVGTAIHPQVYKTGDGHGHHDHGGDGHGGAGHGVAYSHIGITQFGYGGKGDHH